MNYEGEREPQTFIVSNPLFAESVPGSFETTFVQNLAAARVDWQARDKTRLTTRWNYYTTINPFARDSERRRIRRPPRPSSSARVVSMAS